MKIEKIDHFLIYLIFTSLILSEILFVNSSYGPISVFFVFIIPVIIIFFVLHRYILFSQQIYPLYLYMVFLLVYIFLGAIKNENIGLLAQIYNYIFIPVLFMHVGYFSRLNHIYKPILVLSTCVLLSAFSQFLYHSYQINGPFNIFQSLSNYMTEVQEVYKDTATYGRATGLFINPNELGYYGGLCFWFFYLYYYKTNTRLSLFGMVISIITILLSLSRTSVIALISSLVIVYVIKIFKGKQKINFKSILPTILVTFLTYKIVSALNQGQADRLVEILSVAQGDTGSSSNLSSRITAWNNIHSYVTENPWGTLSPPIAEIGISPDSQFVYFYAQGGLILLFLTILFYIYLFKTSVQIKFNGSYTALGSFIFFMISSLTMPVLNSFITAIFWTIFGIHILDLFQKSDTRLEI